MTIEFGYRTPMISVSAFYSTTMTTQSLVTSVRTKCWILSEEIIHGLVSAHSLRTTANLVRLAQGPKHLDTDHMAISDNSQSRRNPGTRSPWTSLNNYYPPKVIQPS